MGDARRRQPWRTAEVVAATALAAALIGFGVPRLTGAKWSGIGSVLGALSVLEIAGLTVLWLAGLWAHTIALAAALPGLSHRRAFFLNITGSCVSNLLPLGGTAGTAVNYAACRGWGFSTAAFLRWALVTNIWDVLGRLAVPGVALVWLALDSSGRPGELGGAAVAGTLVLGLFLTVTVFLVRRDWGSRTAGHLLDWLARRLHRSVPPGGGYTARARDFRRDSAALIATAWTRLTVGKVAYAALQAALLWLCLEFVGSGLSFAVVFAAFAIERVLSLAVITPAATGFVELGMTGFLVSSGGDPAATAAAVLLYRTFVIGLEVPVGGVGLLWWTDQRVRARRRAAALGENPESTMVDQGSI